MRSESQQMQDGRQAYCIGWLALLFGLGGAIAVLQTSGMVIDPNGLFSYSILILLFGTHLIYSKFRPVRSVALTTGSVALMFGSALLAGIIANAGMRLRYPLIDASLAAADQAMGIDTPAVVRAFADSPFLAELMGVAYTSIFPLAFIAAILLAVRGEAQRLWELTVGFGAGILIAAIVSVFFPALGNFSYAGLEQLAGTSLPAGSGIYHLHAVAAYRDGLDPLLDVRKLEGVVTFPSFHMVMAIIVGYAFRFTGILGWLIGFWCILVAVSTIPIGGHYVIDLVAGAVLWGILRWACVERRQRRFEIQHGAPATINGMTTGAA